MITIIHPNLNHHLNKLLKVHRPRPIPVSILEIWSEADKKSFPTSTMSANSSSVIITPAPKKLETAKNFCNSHQSTSSLPRAPSSTRSHLHPEIFCNSTQNYKERVTLSYSWNMFLYSSIWEEADSTVCYFKVVLIFLSHSDVWNMFTTYLIFVTDTTDGVCVKKNCPV